MNKWFQLGNFVEGSLKGITPKYIDKSDVIVLNQKCIRNNKIDYSFSQFHDPSKTFNDKKILRIGDLLFNSTGQGTAGRCAFVRNLPTDKKVITDSHILIIRINDYHLAECFSYSFYKEEKFIQSFMDGSTGQGELDKLRLFNVEFRLPEKSNRKAVCEFFNSIDQKIELNNQINVELEGLAKLVYDYWFVQFDFPTPARYAAAVDKPDMEAKPYKASGGKMVYNEVLKREIPEGWEVKKLKEFAKTGSGGTPLKSKKEYYSNATIPWINSGEVNNPFIVSATKFINSNGLAGSSAKLFPKGTILMAMYGATAGQVSLIDIEASTNQAICAISPKKECFKYYLKFALEDLYQYLVNLSSGSARDNLSQDKIKNIHFPIPDDLLIENFHQQVNPMMDRILINLKENQELSDFRDWLLPMLMNGQVKVKEASSYGKYEVEDDLKMVAENEPVYGKEEKLEDLFPTLNYDFELATVVLLTEQRFNCNYGKKYFHKMFSNMQFLASLPKINKLQFAEKGWGMFSKGLAKSIDKEVYIQKSKLDKAYGVYKVKSHYYKEVINWINIPQNKLFVSEVNAMLSIYEKPLIKGSMDRIELLNTVLECIKVLGTYKFPLIYNKMKTWKMEEPEFEYKANKFKPEETMHMVALVRELKMGL